MKSFHERPCGSRLPKLKWVTHIDFYLMLSGRMFHLYFVSLTKALKWPWNLPVRTRLRINVSRIGSQGPSYRQTNSCELQILFQVSFVVAKWSSRTTGNWNLSLRLQMSCRCWSHEWRHSFAMITFSKFVKATHLLFIQPKLQFHLEKNIILFFTNILLNAIMGIQMFEYFG